MTSTQPPAAYEVYRRLYGTRPLSLDLPKLLCMLLLLPALMALAGGRILIFLVFNAAYLLMPRRCWRAVVAPSWVWQLILLLSFGIIFRTPAFDQARALRRRLVVMNHHGVQDVFLFHFLQRIGVTRLVVSYPPEFYAQMRRRFFFFDHDFEVIATSQRRKIVSGGPGDVTMVFPEGAGKKGPYLLQFQSAIFRLHEEVAPFAVSNQFAIPLLDFYGVDLPGHKWVCFLLLILTPWTVIAVQQLKPFRFDRAQPEKAAQECRNLIKRAIGYQEIDLLFDQKTFDTFIGVSHAAKKGVLRRFLSWKSGCATEI